MESELQKRLEKSLVRVTAALRAELFPTGSLASPGLVPGALSQVRRLQLISTIEFIILGITRSVARGEPPVFRLRNRHDWNNVTFNNRLELKHVSLASSREVRFSALQSRSRFAVLLLVLAKMHRLLMTHSSCTRRELYYQNVSAVRSQSAVDTAVRDACCLLEAPSWQLGLLATSRGRVAGALALRLARGDILDCGAPGGVLIPQDVQEVSRIVSPARFVLVVEKDAVFQKLLDEGALDRLGPCIFLTGCGFPDTGTRLLARRLWETLRVPIWALVDADPYGIEIFCVYRYGSLSMSDLADALAVPATRWLGILPTEIRSLVLPMQPLTLTDRAKLHSLAARPYIRTNTRLLEQVESLLRGDGKAEIESVAGFSSCYLTDGYIPNKILSGDFL